jgi:hypothetical protein
LNKKGFLADKTTPTFSFDPNNANRINQVDFRTAILMANASWR